ncbi:uncharacterized protein LOC144162967 [Haemaphysalis longicornis]
MAASEHPQRTRLRYQSNSTFVLTPKSAGGGASRVRSSRISVQNAPSASKMVVAPNLLYNSDTTAATALPVSSTINTPSARASYMAFETSNAPMTMTGLAGLHSGMRGDDTFDGDFASEVRRPPFNRRSKRSRYRRGGGSASRLLPPAGFDADDESERHSDDRRPRRSSMDDDEVDELYDGAKLVCTCGADDRRPRRTSMDDDEVDELYDGAKLVCTCGASSGGRGSVGRQRPGVFEDLYVLKKTGERRKRKKKKPPAPPPPPPAGFMGMVCSLFGSKPPPPPPPPAQSSSESEYESEYELMKLDGQQLEQLCRLIDFKQFLDVPKKEEKKEEEKKEEKKEEKEEEPAKPPPIEPLDVKVPVVFVFGGPGSGKGTQCEKIVKKYDFTHISSGDLLRAEVQSGSERGREMNEIMKKGELVPLDIVLQLLKEAIKKSMDKSKGFLIDGYPRNTEQGDRFEAEVCKCTHLLYFEVADETMKSRLLQRGETSGRVDDNEATIIKRIKTFHEESEPVLEKYKSMVKKVTAEDDPDKVFEAVVPVMDEIIKSK